MPVEADDGLTTTTGDLGAREGEHVDALRWVYPPGGLLSILTETPAVFGRSPACTTRLDASRVSRRHAEVTFVSGHHVVRDLGSKNGVFVNAVRVTESVLRTGDVLRLGNCVALVERVKLGGLTGFRDLGQGILGGAQMALVVESARAAAAEKSPILLLGEMGTGKALLAHAIHRYRARGGPLVHFDCAARHDGVAAELFGFPAGGSSGAENAGVGCIQAAEGGTLVLDAITELPIELQMELTTVLEAKKGDVCFVATTTRAFDDVPAGRLDARFRNDFERRVIRIPPLRERRPDILPLFLHFIERHGSTKNQALESELAEALCLRNWSLNVRELESVAERLVSVRKGEGDLELGHLLELVPSPLPSAPPPPSGRRADPRRSSARPSYPAGQIAALKAALERHQGNLTKACNELGITRSKAYRMLGSPDPDA
jgi:DNA-binding NtrC family response regulator